MTSAKVGYLPTTCSGSSPFFPRKLKGKKWGPREQGWWLANFARSRRARGGGIVLSSSQWLITTDKISGNCSGNLRGRRLVRSFQWKGSTGNDGSKRVALFSLIFTEVRVPFRAKVAQLVSAWPSVRGVPSSIPGDITSLFQLLSFLCSFDLL